jgi:cysteine synthase
MNAVISNMFSGPAFAAAEKARERRLRLVPEEFKSKFTVVETNTGAFGVGVAAACNKCGALVHQTALDRHTKFHEEQATK